MATTGNTTTTALSDSLPTIIAAARIVREYEGTMTSSSVVDKVTLKANSGIGWNEIRLDKLTAQGVTEATVLNNPQQMEGIQRFARDLQSAVGLLHRRRIEGVF